MTDAENPKSEADQVDSQAEQIQIELSYQRADGTIERATTPEEAIARCPYLGKLPLEQANVLLELSRKGQELMAEAIDTADVIKPDKEAPIIKVGEQSTVITTKKSEVLDVIDITIAPEATVALQDGYLKPEAVIASKELDDVLKMVNDTLLSPKAERQDIVKENLIADEIANKTVSEEAVDKPASPIAGIIEITKPTPITEAVQEVEVEPRKIELPTITALPIVELVTPTIPEIGHDLEESEPSDESVVQQISEELLIINHEQDEFDKRPEDTFMQLLEMLDLPVTDFIEINIAPPLLDIKTSEQSIAEDSVNSVFENYIDSQTEEETVPTIELIRAEAEDQPLEVSLRQLVSLIVESSPQNETLIAEIFELTEIFTANEAEISKIRFDPEMLAKILSLLKLIGYETPEQSLLDLVARYNLVFLISAMRYLHELSDPRKRREFSITNFLKPIVGAVINPLAEIIGRTAIRLFRDSETTRLAY